MNAKEKIYAQNSFDDEHIKCPHCGWDGTGAETYVAGFYGISKYKEVLCPKCNEYLGNLSRERTFGDDRLDSQIGPR
jgi:DNA-directed RNA polymerase subunit RPC12/RpoP